MTLTKDHVTTALAALDGQELTSLQVVPATQLAAQYYPRFDPGQPVLLLDIQDAPQARRIRGVLAQVYPDGHELDLLRGGERQTLRLAQLDAQEGWTPGTACFVPALLGPASYGALQDVVAHLRAPEGCPWDRELTWAKLRASLLEETHELLAALDADDAATVREELGDLLLQVGLQAQIATEEGHFRFTDVIRGIVEKLVRRHPHVFGDAVVNGTAEVLANWEAIKRAERAARGDSAEKRSPLAGIPAGLPALAQADAYLDRMSRLRQAQTSPASWPVLAERCPELTENIVGCLGQGGTSDAAVTREAFGQLLFELVAWAQAHGLDAESALRATNARFAAQVTDEDR